MNCRLARESLGAFLDGELPVEARAAVEAHLVGCKACAVELDSLRALTESLEGDTVTRVPDRLWEHIERRLDSKGGGSHRILRVLSGRRLALAASIVIAIGLGTWAFITFDGGASVAKASVVDFSVLLDALPTNAVGAFEKFLNQYEARPVSVEEAKSAARQLDFDIPETLPGGFRLEQAYTMRFGGETGAAARYSRNGEFLGAIFHRPVHREDFGSHKDYDCVIGKHHGHAVAVGEWKLVHVTDATTCHCVLSKLSEKDDLPGVMAKVAPNSAPTAAPDSHGDGH